MLFKVLNNSFGQSQLIDKKRIDDGQKCDIGNVYIYIYMRVNADKCLMLLYAVEGCCCILLHVVIVVACCCMLLHVVVCC